MSLMERMKVASDLQTMSAGEKLFGSIQVALFGIAVVFLALFLLFVIIKALEMTMYQAEDKHKASVGRKEAAKTQVQATAKVEKKVEEEVPEDDMQLVAAITAAVAASLHTSTHNIIVRNIVRVPEVTPAWGKLGRMQQVNRIE